MPESKTSPRRIEAVRRQQQAVELRMAGRTFEEIAATLGYASRAGAYMSVQAALDKTLKTPTDHYRALNAERLNKILQVFWVPMSVEKNEKAAAICLKAVADLRALQGLDAKEPAPGSSRDHPLWTQPVDAMDLSTATDAELDFILDKVKAIQEAGRIAQGHP